MDIAARFSSRLDYHQLPSYAKVMESINWDVVPVAGAYVFIKRLGPISFGKLQRPENIDLPAIIALQRTLHMVQFFLEPGLATRINGKVVSDQERTHLLLQAGFQVTKDHHAYTKTYVCSIVGTEKQVLLSFSQTARYHIRKSLQAPVVYESIPFAQLPESVKQEILALHASWSKEKHVMGYTDSFLYAMWREMSKEGVMVLARFQGKLIGAMFALAHHRVGMYFYQFSSREARSKLHVPSGLAYQALRVVRERGCDLFDLCSAYDERYGSEHLAWKGFTEHKEQYHPTSIYYPGAFVRYFRL